MKKREMDMITKPTVSAVKKPMPVEFMDETVEDDGDDMDKKTDKKMEAGAEKNDGVDVKDPVDAKRLGKEVVTRDDQGVVRTLDEIENPDPKDLLMDDDGETAKDRQSAKLDKDAE